MQYEQYEQEVRELQGLIEEAHRVIQDRPITTSSVQELQAQILHHEVIRPQLSKPGLAETNNQQPLLLTLLFLGAGPKD